MGQYIIDLNITKITKTDFSKPVLLFYMKNEVSY